MNQGVNIPISLSNSDDFDDIVDDSDEQFDASALVLDSAVDNTDKEVPMPMFSDAPAANPNKFSSVYSGSGQSHRVSLCL